MIKNLSTKLFVSLSIAGCISTYGQCAPVSEFSENFDALFCCNMGVVPPCWDSYVTQDGGNQIISNTAPASSPRNVYQIGYNKVSIVIMPPLSNINAGTHHFKIKARVNPGSAPGFLEFGYITDIANISTFVVLQPITISNGTYDSTSERTFDVPTTVPANARLAIRNPGATFVGHYWDDAIWEPKSNLGTDEIKIDNVKIYPNPFKDVIKISGVKNAEVLKVTDVSGRIVKTMIKPSSEINLSNLKSGVYFLTIQSKSEKVQTFKVIKE
jgi:hypothetical protein